MLGGERRAAPRVAWTGLTHTRIGDALVECVALDLSATGMSVRGAAAPPKGSAVSLSFVVAGHAVDLHGRVMWTSTDPGDSRFGVEFTHIPSESEERLRDFVAQRNLPRTGDTLRNLPAVPDFGFGAHDPAPSRPVVAPRAAVPDIRLARRKRPAGKTRLYVTDHDGGDEG